MSLTVKQSFPKIKSSVLEGFPRSRSSATMGPMSPPTAPGIRARNRAAIEAEIRTVGRRHLAEHGAAALSLRAVARDLGMVPSALYRYVSSRDDLLTLLIVDAYDDLGDAVDAALAELDRHDAWAAQHVPTARTGPRARFVAVAAALRRWAIANPAEYALLYGSPVPDYQAPAERTTEAGTRVLAHLLTLAGQAGTGRREDPHGLDETVQRRGAEALTELAAQPEVTAAGVGPAALLRVLAAWAMVQGAVTSELFQQLGPHVTADPEHLFAAVADLAAILVFGDDD